MVYSDWKTRHSFGWGDQRFGFCSLRATTQWTNARMCHMILWWCCTNIMSISLVQNPVTKYNLIRSSTESITHALQRCRWCDDVDSQCEAMRFFNKMLLFHLWLYNLGEYSSVFSCKWNCSPLGTSAFFFLGTLSPTLAPWKKCFNLQWL